MTIDITNESIITIDNEPHPKSLSGGEGLKPFSFGEGFGMRPTNE